MKKVFILTFVLTFSIVSLQSQVTIGTIEKQKEDKIVLKPEPYDSLKNIKFQEDPINYYQYVGLKLYVIPFKNPTVGRYRGGNDNFLFSLTPPAVYKPFPYFSGNVNGSIYNAVSSDSASVCGKYFTVLDIYYGKKKDSLLKRFDHNVIESPGSGKTLIFLLRNDENGDSLICSNPFSQMILVPYFVKQKQLYEKNNLIVDGSTFQKNDIVTNKTVSVEKGSKWTCSEVTLLQKKQVYPQSTFHYDDDKYFIFYVLKNSKNETIALDKLQGGYDNYHYDYGNDFILESDYIKREQEKKLKQEELIAKQKQEEKIKKEKEKVAQEKHKADCIGKFGQYNGELIAQGKVKIGMTTEMSASAWGEPFWSTRTTVEGGVYENWYYGFGFSLHFVNGKLKRIEE